MLHTPASLRVRNSLVATINQVKLSMWICQALRHCPGAGTREVWSFTLTRRSKRISTVAKILTTLPTVKLTKS